MTAATRQIEEVAARVSRSASPDPALFDTVDLSEEVVQLRVARAASEVDKHLLDLLA